MAKRADRTPQVEAAPADAPQASPVELSPAQIAMANMLRAAYADVVAGRVMGVAYVLLNRDGSGHRNYAWEAQGSTVLGVLNLLKHEISSKLTERMRAENTPPVETKTDQSN